MESEYCQDREVLAGAVKITYDPETDTFQVVFTSAPVQESDAEKPGVILDFDKDGNIVGIEILDASKRVDNPRTLEYAVAS
jgi:uncharacterized protein YuzE